MSRSYKKTPVLQDKYGSKTNKWSKRQASKASRRYKEYIAKGKSYKKIYCSWNISDYKVMRPWDVYAKDDFKNKKEWAKYYYYK